METDNLWGTDPPPADPPPAVPPTDTPAPAVAAAAPAPGVTQDQLAEVQAQMTQSIADMGETLGNQIAQSIQSAAPPPPPAPVQSAEDVSADMFADPKGTVQSIVDASLANQVMPAVMPAINAVHDLAMETQRMAVDKEYGDGSFDSIVRPGIEKTMETIRAQNPTALADAGMLKRARDLAVGQNVPALIEHRDKFRKDTDERVLKERTELTESIVTNIPGGNHFVTRTSENPVDEEAMKDYAAVVAGATGTVIDMKELAKSRNAGNTLESFKAAHKQQEAG